MITPLKDKDDSFGSWRENFELQVGSTWLHFEKVLLMIRDHPSEITREVYVEFINESRILEGQEYHTADWDFFFVSKKIYMLLHNYGDVGVRKILVESPELCGLEAYRLLNKAFDPVNDDLEYSLQQSVTAICKWPTKNVHDELAALREASVRIKELERRTGKTAKVLSADSPVKFAHNAQLKVYAGMIFANILSQSTKRYIMQQADGISKRGDIESIRKSVEELVKLELGSKPMRMDVSNVQAPDDQYSPDEWREWEAENWDYEYGTWERTEEEEAAPSLDAFGQKGSKGKGKGYGKKGKGKGEYGKGFGKSAYGKGYGKGWGKGDYGKGKKGKGKGEWVETRECHNCHKTGHLARDCPEPAKARAYSAAGTENGAAAPLSPPIGSDGRPTFAC